MTEPSAQSAEAIDSTKSETCGNCKFSHRINVGTIECRGLPPAIILLGMQQTALGQQPATALMRPNLPSSLDACALYQRGKGLLLIGTQAMANGHG